MQKINDPSPADAPTLKGGSSGKIEVLIKNTGSAPILSKSKWVVTLSSTVSDVIVFLRKYLKEKLDPNASIFIYVNQSFAPPLDQTIQNLYDCYQADKKLVLYYAITQAWG